MLGLVVTAVLLVAATVAIHAFGTTSWLRYLVHRYADPDGNFKAHAALPAVTFTSLVLLLLHMIEVVLWALAYLLVLPGDHLATFEKATYFSMVTFTTLVHRSEDPETVSVLMRPGACRHRSSGRAWPGSY